MKILLTFGIALFAAAALAQTSISPVNIGTTANDGTGDPVRTAFTKVNANDASLNLNKAETNNPTFSGTVTLRSGTTPQRMDIYSTFIDSSNYKRLSIYTDSGDQILELGALGTPLSGGDFKINTPARHSFRLQFGGTDFSHSYYNFDTNRFAALSLWDGLLDLGGSDRRWKNVYGVNFYGDNFIFPTLTFTNPATGPALGYHVGGQVVVTGGPGEVDVQFTGGTANGSAATVNVSADNLSSGNDVSAGNNVNAGNSVTAGNTVTAGSSVSVASGSSLLGPLALTLAGATISQQTQSATSPTRGWRQLNFGFFVSPTGPTNNFFQFDAETLFKGAGDYAGYEWLHQDGSVSFDKSGTTNKFTGTFSGTLNNPTVTNGATITGLLQIAAAGGIAFSKTTVAIGSGENLLNPGTNTYIEATGSPSGLWSFGGISGGTDGRVLIIANSTSQDMDFAQQFGGESAANRINTGLGADYTNTNRPGIVALIYNAGTSRWNILFHN